MCGVEVGWGEQLVRENDMHTRDKQGANEKGESTPPQRADGKRATPGVRVQQVALRPLHVYLRLYACV